MVEIPLTQLVDTVRDGDPVAKLVLDPSNNSETFFKYKGSLCIMYLPGEVNSDVLRRHFRHSVQSGDTMVLSMGSGQTLNLNDFFDPQVLPREVLNRDLLTLDVLAPFKNDERDYFGCSPEFHFVVLLNTFEIPEWAQSLVNQRRLKVVKIV